MIVSKSSADYWADWLVDAVATATQDRRFLRGDPAEDTVAIEALFSNGKKAMENLLRYREQKARDMTPAERTQMESATRELHAEFDALFARREQQAASRWCIHSNPTLCKFPDCGCERRS